MPLRALRAFLLGLTVLGFGTIVRGGMNVDTPYTEKGKTDFDTALQLLNPYGTWSKIGEKWAYTPNDHMVPYTNGRWIYTEYGWYWKGLSPHGWMTEHYGYWKRAANKVWSWYPGPYWLPQIVEIRATDKYLGWRCGEVDRGGNYVEKTIDRYSKPDEWTFVTLAQFANPITPETAAKTDVAKAQLEISTDCRHTYLTYRELDRPGPHPADFADFSKDGGMLAPKTLRDELAPQTPAPSTTIPGYTPSAPVTNTPATTNAPTDLGNGINPGADTRQVKYWITMSLPTFWTKPPPDATPEQIYLYRPDFYQDEDGIARRISLWFNPKERTTLKDVLAGSRPAPKPEVGTVAPGTPATPAVPAAPAESTPERNPFGSPFNDSFHGAGTNHPANPSSKNSAVPTGLSPGGATVPPTATNSAPVK